MIFYDDSIAKIEGIKTKDLLLDIPGGGDDLPLVGEDGVDLVASNRVDGHAAGATWRRRGHTTLGLDLAALKHIFFKYTSLTKPKGLKLKLQQDFIGQRLTI